MNFRYLKLNLKVEQPGHYCCDDGTCIKSKYVRDGIKQCPGGDDEIHDIVNKTNPEASIDAPPFEAVKNENEEGWEIIKTKIKANITVLQIFNIDSKSNTIELSFLLDLMWYDAGVNFLYLNENVDLNYFPFNTTWTPKIKIYHLTNVYDYGDKLFVEKNASFGPILSEGMESLYGTELYSGKSHLIHLVLKRRIVALCPFENIENYPFGEERCDVGFFIEGPSNRLTEIVPIDIVTTEKTEILTHIAEFKLEKWNFIHQEDFTTGEQGLLLQMVLSRDVYSIFMVTYLPTILINFLNQAANHIPGLKF